MTNVQGRKSARPDGTVVQREGKGKKVGKGRCVVVVHTGGTGCQLVLSSCGSRVVLRYARVSALSGLVCRCGGDVGDGTTSERGTWRADEESGDSGDR